MQNKDLAVTVHRRLLGYYGNPVLHKPMPPLDNLVLTILSQNTNDTNRDQAFKRLRERYPTWEAVRDAEAGSVIEAIRTAGLANQKGPRIQSILRQISQERGVLDLEFLRTMGTDEAHTWLTKFKGVGPKTAAIVLLFSLDKPAFPVDTHIYRVSGRLGLRPMKMNVDKTHDLLFDLFPQDAYYAAHLNIIRLGREICHPRKPKCGQCPLRQTCAYYAEQYDPD